MTTFFVWIESASQPPSLNLDPSQPVHRITFAVEQLPSGPVRHLQGLVVREELTARRCDLLRQQNGIQVSIEGEHTMESVVDKALAKIGNRAARSRADRTAF
jgi:hypothetical protein